MIAGTRRRTLRSRLVAAGFTDTSRAAACLRDPALVRLLEFSPGRDDAAPCPAGVASPGPGSGGEGAGAAVAPSAAPGRGCTALASARQSDPAGSALPDQSQAASSTQVALLEALGGVADPDLALMTLVRLAQAVQAPGAESALRQVSALLEGLNGTRAGSQEEGHELTPVPRSVGGQGPTEPGPVEQVTGEPDVRRHLERLLAVLGASSALGDVLVAHPDLVASLSPAQAWDAAASSPASAVLSEAARRELCADPSSPARAQAALRLAYYDRLLAVAADDLTSPDPLAHVETVGRRMAALVDAALDAALMVARARVGQKAVGVRLAVVALGKTGAQELNYLSDVDVVYVVEPAGGQEDITEADLTVIGSQLATELAHVVSAPGAEPALWPLDSGLRPEGKDGALVRTLDSYRRYYQRWASSWEFQALLKARAAAGDRELGAAFEALVDPLVWQASQREHFVDDARAMRRRVETESAPRGTATGQDRRIKLGPGGLRDVEFTVQLLQLVHGRADASLRVRPTLTALAALRDGGYVSRQDAQVLEAGYRFERLVEHRCQLLRLRRTHELPASDERLRVVGRGLTGLTLPECLGPLPESDDGTLADPSRLRAAFASTKRRVRTVHEQVYYRPLLTVAATLSRDELVMTEDAARARLAAGGYVDPDGALAHIRALTDGVTRRAAIQRHILPVIISWLSDGPDPDGGLLSFRRLSETIGGTHWYLAMLRDSPVAAQRLCQVLSGTRWTTERLMERPEAIAWLDCDHELDPRPAGAVAEEVRLALRRRADALDIGPDGQTPGEGTPAVVAAMEALASLRAREQLRAALADCLLGMDPVRCGAILTDVTDAVLGGALAVATGMTLAGRLGQVPQLPGEDGRWPQALADTAIIAMGRYGGGETTYASDADVLFVHRVREGVDPAAATREADAVARLVLTLLASARPHPLQVDADLRPEGRQGPMSRSLESYRDYYARWSSAWERQALVRARPAAGDREVGRSFVALIDPLRWAGEGLDRESAREVRRLKARMEAERLPRGVEASRHLKLGPGGLADVEWSVQVLQMAHAGAVAGLRTTSTLAALEAARDTELLAAQDASTLRTAWLEAGSLRAANVIGSGRDSGVRVEVLASDPREVRIVGRLLGAEPGGEREILDHYRRDARHARVVAERLIYGTGAAEQTAGARSAGLPASRSSVPTSSGQVSAVARADAGRGDRGRAPMGSPRRPDPRGAMGCQTIPVCPGGPIQAAPVPPLTAAGLGSTVAGDSRDRLATGQARSVQARSVPVGEGSQPRAGTGVSQTGRAGRRRRPHTGPFPWS